MTGEPYHDAELALQERTGRKSLAAMLGNRVSPEITAEVAEFLPSLPHAILGTIDAQGWPWASIVAGPAGFLLPKGNRLTIRTRVNPDDPLKANLASRSDLGLLAIDLAAKRRYRINGKARSIPGSILLDVEQCYRNCPQYINVRQASWSEPCADAAPVAARRTLALDDEMVAVIRRADTFFIATHGSGSPGIDPRLGSDVSHRGGNPGFVSVQDDGQRLSFPDYVGNFMFNTLGNLTRYPRCGLMFIDFDTGSTLQITGTASIDWSLERASAIPGAQRLIDMDISAAVWTENTVPLSWRFVEPARDLRRYREPEPTSVLPASSFATAPPAEGFERVTVSKIIEEADDVRSFYLKPVDGKPRAFRAGQHLQVRLSRKGEAGPLIGHYSLSRFDPSAREYRIGVRRDASRGEASVSTFLHDHVGVGSELFVSLPRGRFTLDPDPDRTRPLALISAGIGVTPVLAMLQALASANAGHPIWFIHGARNGAEQAYAAEVRRISDKLPNITAHIRYSQPRDIEVLGRDHDSVGRVDAALVTSLVPHTADFYLCGPVQFMDEIRTSLRLSGVAEEQIRFESFGGGLSSSEPPEALGREGAQVRFGDKGVTAAWSSGYASLLEIAEAEGLHPPFSCRTGECGTCEHRLAAGEVVYPREPAFQVPRGHVLLCCAQPVSDVVIEDLPVPYVASGGA